MADPASLTPSSEADGWNAQGCAEMHRRRAESAIDRFRQAVLHDPVCAAFHANLGTALRLPLSNGLFSVQGSVRGLRESPGNRFACVEFRSDTPLENRLARVLQEQQRLRRPLTAAAAGAPA